MTIFGPDVSSFQNGLDLAQLRAASFVIAKTTEGTYYTDADYQGWRQQAGRLGLPFVWYHFLSGEDPHAQVAHTKANVGDTSLPGMLDVEPEGTFSPPLTQVLAWLDAARAAALHVPLVYLPRWFWQQLGSPDLTPIAARGAHLISSSYPGGAGTPTQLYPGDKASGWQGYGGITPLLYQYTNQATDGGKPLDYNAFRGTAADLITLLGGNMNPVDVWAWRNPTLDPIDMRQRLVNAELAAETSAAKADQVLAAVAKLAIPAAPVVDVNALATALAPLLATGPTADQVAVAVQQHLAAQLVKP